MLVNAPVIVQGRGGSWSGCYVEKCWKVTNSGFFCSDSVSSDIFRISVPKAVSGSHVNHNYLISMYFYLPSTLHLSSDVAIELCWN